jgi:hypothetical protein
VLKILLVVEHYFMSLLQRLWPRLPLQELVPFKLLDQVRTSQWVTRLKVSLLLHLRLLPFSQVFVLRLEIILDKLLRDSWVKGDSSADGFKGTALRFEFLEEVIE